MIRRGFVTRATLSLLAALACSLPAACAGRGAASAPAGERAAARPPVSAPTAPGTPTVPAAPAASSAPAGPPPGPPRTTAGAAPTTTPPAPPARSGRPAPRPPDPASSGSAAPHTPSPGRSTAPGPVTTAPAAEPRAGRGSGTTLRIGSWSASVVRGDQETIDACRDAVQWTGPPFGEENGHALRTIVIVGHDYCGFERFATLPLGTEVTVETPRRTLTYTVYQRHLTPGRGVPAHGLFWGDLTLQSCVGPDTGFTYLMRT